MQRNCNEAAMPKPEELRKLARDFRQHAGETNMPVYARMMLQAASDLDALTEGADIESPSDPVRRIARS